MEIAENRIGETLVMSLTGHLDTATSSPLEERLRGLIAHGTRQLVLDLAGVDYVNSSGLKAILIAAKELEAAAGKLVLCGLSSNVLMIFEMIGFTRILNIVGSRDEALRAFNADAAAA